MRSSQHAISLDDNRPADDISVLVLKVIRAHRRRRKADERQASHQWLRNTNITSGTAKHRWQHLQASIRDTTILLSEFRSAVLWFSIAIIGGGILYYSLSETI